VQGNYMLIGECSNCQGMLLLLPAADLGKLTKRSDVEIC